MSGYATVAWIKNTLGHELVCRKEVLKGNSSKHGLSEKEQRQYMGVSVFNSIEHW